MKPETFVSGPLTDGSFALLRLLPILDPDYSPGSCRALPLQVFPTAAAAHAAGERWLASEEAQP